MGTLLILFKNHVKKMTKEGGQSKCQKLARHNCNDFLLNMGKVYRPDPGVRVKFCPHVNRTRTREPHPAPAPANRTFPYISPQISLNVGFDSSRSHLSLTCMLRYITVWREKGLKNSFLHLYIINCVLIL